MFVEREPIKPSPPPSDEESWTLNALADVVASDDPRPHDAEAVRVLQRRLVSPTRAAGATSERDKGRIRRDELGAMAEGRRAPKGAVEDAQAIGAGA
jgi:hypothetical protein